MKSRRARARLAQTSRRAPPLPPAALTPAPAAGAGVPPAPMSMAPPMSMPGGPPMAPPPGGAPMMMPPGGGAMPPGPGGPDLAALLAAMPPGILKGPMRRKRTARGR